MKTLPCHAQAAPFFPLPLRCLSPPRYSAAAPPSADPMHITSRPFLRRSTQIAAPHFLRGALPFYSPANLFRSDPCFSAAGPLASVAFRFYTMRFLSLAIASAAIPSPCLLPLRFSAASPCAASPSHAIPAPFPSELNYSHAVLQPAFPLPMSCIAMQIVSYAAFFYSAASMT